MKRNTPPVIISFILVILLMSFILPGNNLQTGYILEHEKDIAAEQAGPHNGGGTTTAFNFFSKAPDLKMAFRKRVLHAGSAIGYHLQKEDEIYYIISGSGTMKMNEESFAVKAGDAILTRPGSWHGLTPDADTELTLLITYAVP